MFNLLREDWWALSMDLSKSRLTFARGKVPLFRSERGGPFAAPLFEQPIDSAHKGGSTGAQFADALPRHLFQQFFAARQQRNEDASAIVAAS